MPDDNNKHDIDFDELDKAVNSLMGSHKSDDDSEPQTLDINDTLSPNEEPAFAHLGEAADGIGEEATDRQERTVSLDDDPKNDDSETELEGKKEIVPRKGGRFMDVVHPSSVMRGSTSRPAKNISHEAATLEAPDIDMEDIKTTTGELPESSDSSDSDGENFTDSTEPLTSPFLSDAKVEKRPLGSPKTGDELDEENSEDDDDKLEELQSEEDNAVTDLTEVNEHIPEEFQPDLLEVEKGAHDPIIEDDNSAHKKIKAETLDDVDKPDKKHSDKGDKKTKDENSDKKDVEVDKDQPLFEIASIPKQYSEKPSTGDKSSGGIFDTDHYHKPLAHPAEQKSGWSWVIMIVILIFVGALLGASAYFFGVA